MHRPLYLPCRNSGGCLSASLRSGPGLALPVQWEYMWDLWWAKRHWRQGISVTHFSPCILVLSLSIVSCDGVISAFTRLWAGRSGVWIQTAAVDYSLQNFRSYCWSHPTVLHKGRGSCLPRGKTALDFYHLPPSCAEVKDEWIFSSAVTCTWKTLTSHYYIFILLLSGVTVSQRHSTAAAPKNFIESTGFL